MSKSLLSIKDILRRESAPSFYQALDLYGVEDGVVIGTSGVMGVGYQFEGRDLLLESDAWLEDFEQRARRFLNMLPDYISCHFLVHSREGDESALQGYAGAINCKDKLADKIVLAKTEGFRQQPFHKRNIYLYVIYQPGGHPKTSSVVSAIREKKVESIEYFLLKNILTQAASDIQNGFKDLGFSLSKLTNEEILKWHFEMLNPRHAFNGPDCDENILNTSRDGETLRSRLLFSAPRIQEDSFYLDGYYHKGINLRLAPDETTLKSMRDFEMSLGFEYLLSVSFQTADQEKEKGRIRRQGNFAKAQGFFSKSKSHDAEHQSQEADDFLEEIVENTDRIFHVCFSVLVKARTAESVEKLSLEVLRAFPKLGDARGLIDDMNHDRLLLSNLPLQGHYNPLSFLFRTESLIHLLPLQASWKGTDNPGLLLKTWRGEAVNLDLFDPALSSKHALMLGSTGSGKSFLANHLLLHFLIESPDHEVVVMDIGGSYRKLCEVFGGNYVELECAEEFGLNPFPRKQILFPSQQGADPTFLQFLKELLEQMIAPERAWGGNEKMILERVIADVYRSLTPDQAPMLGDIETALLNYSAGDSDDKRLAYIFAKELSLFTRGEYGKILNQPKTFDYDARFTVFDLRKIAQYPELQEILLLIIPFALRRRFENVNAKKLLVLDECWRFLKEVKGINLIENFYRTARKMNAGVWSITQNPEDYLESKIAGVMINNSPVKYVLRLKKGHEKLGMFGLNENEIQAIRELEVRPGHYGECFVKFDDRAVIVRLSPNPLEYWIATTDTLDLIEEQKSRSSLPKGDSIDVLEHVAQIFPHGVKKASLKEAA